MVPCDEVFRFRFRLPVERVGHVLCLYTNGLPYAAACRGDSGGPLVVCEGDRTVVIGVASFIFNPITSELSLDSKGPRCINDTTVSAYVDIQQYLPWIRRNIGEGNN